MSGMRFRRTTRVLTSWMAVLAILMAALAPSISHALESKNGPSWVEICTSVGAKWVNAGGDAGDEAPSFPGAHPQEHCPYCSLHGGARGGVSCPRACRRFPDRLPGRTAHAPCVGECAAARTTALLLTV
jgi:hypothetical protein